MPSKKPKHHNQPPTPEPINSFKSWPYQPDYSAIALIRKGGLWAVLNLKLRAREVQTYEITTETNFEFAIDKAIRKLAQSVRKAAL